MRKTLLTLFMALATSAVVEAQNVESVAGKYCGEIYVALNEPVTDETDALPYQTVDIMVSKTENAVDFALYNFGFLGMPLGNIELPGVGFVLDNGTGTFAANPAREFSFVGGMIEATAFLDEKTSYVKGDSVVAYINVVWTNGDNTPINVLFKGKKLEPANLQAFDGEYSGTFTVKDEDGTETLSEQKSVKADFATMGTNGATISFGNVELNGATWSNFVFMPAFYAGTADVAAFIPAEVIYMFTSGEQQAVVGMDMSNCSLSTEGGLTLNFVASVGIEDNTCTYNCSYTAQKTNTGISNVEAAKTTNSAAYTLSGLRVNGARLQKGIYIVNGKKTIIK